MPREAELQQSEVFNAMNDLVGAGVYPTQARVRTELGQRGSPVVLARHMEAWYAQCGPSLVNAAVAGDGMAVRPTPAERTLRERMQAVTEEAMRQVSRELEEREAAINARESTQDVLDVALKERESALEARSVAMDKELADSLSREVAANRARDDAAERMTAAVAAQAELAGQLEEARATISRLEKSRQDAEQLQRKLAAAESEGARHAARVRELVAETASLRADLVEDRALKESAKGSLASLRDQMAATTAAHAQTLARADAAEQKCLRLHVDVERMTAQLAAAVAHEASLAKETAALNEALSISKSRLADMERVRDAAVKEAFEQKSLAAQNRVTQAFLEKLMLVDADRLKASLSELVQDGNRKK